MRFWQCTTGLIPWYLNALIKMTIWWNFMIWHKHWAQNINKNKKTPHKVPSFGIIQLNPLHGENSFSFQMLAARGTRGGISTLYCVTWRALIGPWCLAGCRAAPLKTSPFPHQRRLNPDTLHRLLLLLLLRISHQRLQRWLRSLLGRGRWSPARTLTTTWKQLVGESVFASLPVANCEFTVIYANFFWSLV